MADPFEVIESTQAIPRTSKRQDGFSRQDVVNAFAQAFKMIGGVQRLALWANENPDKFFPLYAKLLPATSINFGQGNVIQLVHAIPPSPLDVHQDQNGLPIAQQTVEILQDDSSPSPEGSFPGVRSDNG